MKKFIYIIGIACANLMFIGSMFKVQHWPGANILLVLAMFLFCFVFYLRVYIKAIKTQ